MNKDHLFQNFWRLGLWALGLWELAAIAIERVTGVQMLTWSEFMRRYVRYDLYARPAFLILLCWLPYHWGLRRQGDTGVGWKDAVFAGLGLSWALYEGITGKTLGF